MSGSMSVDREWWHDLGVAEDIDHLQDPEVADMRSEPFDGVACMQCGEEALSPRGDAALCEHCGTLSQPNDGDERDRELCADCGATVPRRALCCLDCGLIAGRADAPEEMEEPLWCPDCEQWHASDDRVTMETPSGHYTYTVCPLCESSERVQQPQMYVGGESESDDDVSSDGQSSFAEFAD